MLHRLKVKHPKRPAFEIGVDEDLIIVETTPLAEAFLGQPLRHLVLWLQKDGPGLEVTEL
jgi:hypothetical protein